jgi:hypothetical protein
VNLQRTQTAAAKRLPARSRADVLARGGILAAGLACLLLLAWGHLGLGALLFPPAPTVAQQTAVAGPYRVTLRLESGQPTARGPNTLVLGLIPINLPDNLLHTAIAVVSLAVYFFSAPGRKAAVARA